MGRTLLALLVANVRYWLTVASLVRRQLRHWEERAHKIEDPALREMALCKLRTEGFNAEAAAMAATLAPRAHRKHAVEAVVALELLFDYLDGVTERPLDDPLADGERLFQAFLHAINPAAPPGHGYAQELAHAVQSSIAGLPAIDAISEVARRCAERGAQAQIRMHAAPSTGSDQLVRWARSEARINGVRWREFLAGAASSVLALHALIAAAADPSTTPADAERIAAAYLSVCTVVTLLDGLVDHHLDAAEGRISYAGLYGDADLIAQALTGAAREASREAGALRGGAHHRMILASAIAYWSSAPGARLEPARAALERLSRDMGPLVAAPLLLMRTWRLARRVSA